MTARRVAVVGYGTAGQAAALWLSRLGFELEVFERVSAPGPAGAGFLLQPTGLWALRQLGLESAALAVGERIEQLLGSTPAGRRVMDLRYADAADGRFGLGMQRGALFQILHDAMPPGMCLHAGTDIVEVDAEGGMLVDATGRRHGPYDWLILADGAASRLRCAAEVQRDRPYRWGAVWGLLSAPPGFQTGRLEQRYAGTRHMAGLLPVGRLPGEDAEVRRLCLYWSAPADQLDSLCAAGETALQPALRGLWPAAAELLASQPEPVEWRAARYRDAVCRGFGTGRVLRIGDAAHAMSPQLGQGVNLALLDAAALGQVLARAPDVTLPELRREVAQARRRHVAVYQRLSRWLTPWFQSDWQWLAPLRDALALPVARVPGVAGLAARLLSGRFAWSEPSGGPAPP